MTIFSKHFTANLLLKQTNPTQHIEQIFLYFYAFKTLYGKSLYNYIYVNFPFQKDT